VPNHYRFDAERVEAGWKWRTCGRFRQLLLEESLLGGGLPQRGVARVQWPVAIEKLTWELAY
jgi:hypothetical protein